MAERSPPSKLSQLVSMLVFFLVIAVAVLFLVGTTREWILGFFRSEEDKHKLLLASIRPKDPAEFFRDPEGHTGLRLTEEALGGLHIEPVAAKPASEARALPPQVGRLNYDNDRLFLIRSRFGGKVAELMQFDKEYTIGKAAAPRPLRYGDKVQQGDLLAVVWSQPLGQAKAALVDAVSNLRLSQDQLDRQMKLVTEGALSEGTIEFSKRQWNLDRNALRTAERSLRTWKLTDQEIAALKKEAEAIAIRAALTSVKDEKAIKDEKEWAKVEIRVPWFSNDKERRLVVVEKNTNLGDMLDPIASPPLFKLADVSRLTIWVQPPEEYLPLLRERLNKGLPVSWRIQFQSEGPDAKPLELAILQIAKSLDPTVYSVMVMGYLPNDDEKYIVGQFVTATIFVPADPDTVEIPTSALNDVGGESLIFVETNAKKREFVARRVAVVHRFKDATIVRSKLTEEDVHLSHVEKLKGRRPLEALLPGERIVGRGIVEMTTCLDTLAVKDQVEKLERQGK